MKTIKLFIFMKIKIYIKIINQNRIYFDNAKIICVTIKNEDIHFENVTFYKKETYK
jgi:hypothetical protein